MKMKWFLLLVSFNLLEANNICLDVKKLHSFRCLLENSFQPCIVFPETMFQNITYFSPKLLRDYSNLNSNFHEAVNQQNFSIISEEVIKTVPDAMLLLLPVNHLSKINSKALLNLILQRYNTKAVKHLVKAYMLRNDADKLYEELQSLELPATTLTWIADVMNCESYGAQRIINNPPILFYSSPFPVLFNNTSEKLFYLSLWEKANSISKEIKKSYLRIWAYAMIKNNFPGLDSWNDLCLERWGILLTASTADELILLNQSYIDNLNLLFNFEFSSIQVRSLFDEFSERLKSSNFNHSTLSNLLIKLLPAQLLYFTEKIPYLDLSKVLPPYKSLPTSKQIFELLMFKEPNVEEKSYPYVNNFSYVLPLKKLSEYGRKAVPSTNLIKIQSRHFSKTQLYILSKGRALFDFKSESIFECIEFINVLPTRDIIFNQTASHVMEHLLANVAAENIPQTFAVFNKLWSVLGTSTTFKMILANKDSDILLEYLPSRYITQFVDSILTALEEDISSQTKLPDLFVSTLLRSWKVTKNHFNLVDMEEPLAFLFNGITCDEISSLDPYDFVIFMFRFTQQRKASGKDFPKILQKCCVEKFLAYIELKYNLFQGVLGESKLSLLNEAEIDSIGGYVFSALPAKSIASSKFSKNIIKSIGQLSLSELIMAAPKSKLREWGSVLIQENLKTDGKIDYSLFDLGNLTLFLETGYISEINETFFKLMLESNYIDHRICADKSSRISWFNLLKLCFGETIYWSYQTLVTLGDLLIVVPAEELNKVPLNSWIYAADVLTSRYNDIMYSSSLKFYEVCMQQLSFKEAELYLAEIKKLIEVFVDAAQIQLNTVTFANSLRKNNDTNNKVFNFLDFNKSLIKIFIPTIPNLINATVHDETSEMNQDLNNKYESQVSMSNVNGLLKKDFFSSTKSTFDFIGNTGYRKGTAIANTNDQNQKNSSTDTIFKSTISLSTGSTKFLEEGNSLSDLNDTTATVNDINPYHETYANEKITMPYHIFTQNSSNQLLNGISNNTESKVSTLKKALQVLNETTNKYFYSTTSLDYTVKSILNKHHNNKTQKYEQWLFTEYSDPYSKNLSVEDGGLKNSKNYDVNESKISQKIHDVSTEFSSLYENSNSASQSFSFRNDEISRNKFELPSHVATEEFQGTKASDISVLDSTFKVVTSDRLPTTKKIMKLLSEKLNVTKLEEDIQSRNKVEIEHLISNNNAKTEYLKLNFSSIDSMFKFKNFKIRPIVIGNTESKRTKRSTNKWSCDAFKMIGKSVEIILTETVIQSLSEEDLNECIDLFAKMDLSKAVQNSIWRKANLEHVFLSGKLISAINISEIESKDLSVSKPWALETIHILGKYSNNLKIRQHVIKESLKNKQPFTVEILVTLGSLICDLPEITSQLIEPLEFFKASVILGRILPCNHSCLFQLSKIAMMKGAFEDISHWNARDVSDLGIIIAGIEFSDWQKLVISKNNPLSDLSASTLKCLPQQHLKELQEFRNLSPIKTYLIKSDLFNLSINFEFFDHSIHRDPLSSDDKSFSIKLIDFSCGLKFQIFCIFILLCLNVYPL